MGKNKKWRDLSVTMPPGTGSYLMERKQKKEKEEGVSFGFAKIAEAAREFDRHAEDKGKKEADQKAFWDKSKVSQMLNETRDMSVRDFIVLAAALDVSPEEKVHCDAVGQYLIELYEDDELGTTVTQLVSYFNKKEFG